MPDYNPDKEGHRDHKFIVQKAQRRDNRRGINYGEKKFNFNKDGRFVLNDESIAREVQKLHPHDLAVTRVTVNHPSDRGHRYFFSVPSMPWHKEKDDGKKVDQESD